MKSKSLYLNCLLCVLVFSSYSSFSHAQSSLMPCEFVKKSSLKNYYKLDGNGSDLVGNNALTAFGGPYTFVSDRFDNPESAIAFNYTKSQMMSQSQSSIPPQKFTISIRFKVGPNSVGGKMVNFANRESGLSTQRGRQIYMGYDGAVYFSVFSSSGSATGVHYVKSSQTYRDNLWHVATAVVTGESGFIELFIDGVSQGVNTNAKGPGYFTKDGQTDVDRNVKGWWRIGGDSFGLVPNNPGFDPNGTVRSNFYFDGVLDDFMFFDDQLSPTDIRLLESSIKEATRSTIPCVGENFTLYAPATVGALSYAWTGPNGWSSGVKDPTVSMALDRIGTYKLTITYNGNCSTLYTVSVNPFNSTGSVLWTGNQNQAWTNGANWCKGVVPSSATDVEISSLKRIPNLSTEVSLTNLTLENNSNLTISGDGKLTVNNNLELKSSSVLEIKDKGNLEILKALGGAGAIDATNGKVTLGFTKAIYNGLFVNGKIKDFEIKGNSVNVSLNSPLQVSGVLTVNDGSTLKSAGNLTLDASEATHARVAQLPSNAKIEGSVNVRTFMKGGAKSLFRGFRMFSSPVYDNTTDNIFGEGNGARTYKLAQLYDNMMITGGNLDYNELGNPSVWAYGAAGYVPITQLDYTLPIGTSFYSFYRGNRSSINDKVKYPYIDVEDNLIDYVGILNQQNVTVQLTGLNGGYALLGNPYASVINWDLVEKTGLTGVIWTFIPGIKSYASYSNGVGTNLAKKYIAMGQGFFVKASGVNAVVTFKENAKVANSIQTSNATNAQGVTSEEHVNTQISFVDYQMQKSILRLTMASLAGNGAEEIALVFEKDEDAKYTQKDAEHWDGEQVNLSSISADGKKLAINFMPLATERDEVKLFATALSSGNYLMQFNMNEYYGSRQVILKDNYLNTSVPVFTGSTYQFAIDLLNNKTFGGDRFTLEFKAPIIVLPLSLASFTAVKGESGVKLSWSLSELHGVQYFRVLRFGDRDGAKEIATVNASLAKSYYVLDNNPGFGRNYYKLFAVNKSGEEVEIGVVDVNFEMLNDNMIYPNPFKDVLNIRFKNATNGVYEVKLVDVAGKVFISKTTTAKKLADGFIIDTSILEKGLYILNVSSKISGQQLHSSSVEKAY